MLMECPVVVTWLRKPKVRTVLVGVVTPDLKGGGKYLDHPIRTLGR